MYKRFSYQDLISIQTQFLPHLKDVLKKERCDLLKEYCKTAFKLGSALYYFNNAGAPLFRVVKQGDEQFTFYDEQEKIEMICGPDELSKLHQLLKTDASLKKALKGNQSIMDILKEQYKSGHYHTIGDKPYVVYDIETTWTGNDVVDHTFAIAYVLDSQTGQYKLVEKHSLQKFVEYLLAFDGYIIGFNQMWFDNPVIVHNIGGDQAMIDELNRKSLDLMVFVQNMTGRRMGLNALSTALIGLQKTLSSGVEGEALYKKYLEEGDEKAYKAYKDYCRNDVEMTHLVLLYMLHYLKIYVEGEEVTYSIEQFVHEANQGKQVKEAQQRNQQEERLL